MSAAGVPARRIAARFELSKRQCNRIISERAREREEQSLRAEGPASALELLNELERMYVRAVELACAAGRPAVLLSLRFERMFFWDERRATLENLIEDALAAQERAAGEEN
jgi:hypothetical protein